MLIKILTFISYRLAEADVIVGHGFIQLQSILYFKQQIKLLPDLAITFIHN